MREHRHFVDDIPRPSMVLLRSRPLVIVVVTAAVALGLVAALSPDWLLVVDEPISEFVRSDDLREPFRRVTRLGSQQEGILVAFLVLALVWGRCRPLAIAFPAVVTAGAITDVVIKVLVDRPRPLGPDVGTALGSFPSGHTIHAVVFYGLLPPAVWVLLRRPRWFWGSVGVAVALVAAVAFSRLYLGAHWPSDVLASAVIGAALLVLAEYAVGSPFARRHCDGCPLHRARIATQGGVHEQRPAQPGGQRPGAQGE